MGFISASGGRDSVSAYSVPATAPGGKTIGKRSTPLTSPRGRASRAGRRSQRRSPSSRPRTTSPYLCPAPVSRTTTISPLSNSSAERGHRRRSEFVPSDSPRSASPPPRSDSSPGGGSDLLLRCESESSFVPPAGWLSADPNEPEIAQFPVATHTFPSKLRETLARRERLRRL